MSIYLDHNATSPPLPEVVAAMAECQANVFANPSSQHSAGRAARRVLEDAREAIAAILGVRLGPPPRGDRLIFTSGGTEANNLAVFGIGAAAATGAVRRVLLSAVEHPSVVRAADELKRRGVQVETLPVTSSGLLNLETLDDAVRGNSSQRASLACIMLANNETGVIQPIAQIAQRLSEHGIPLHSDAVQAAGKITVGFHQSGAASMSIGAHKFHGPRGVGALLVRGGVEFRPQILGGAQEGEKRAGTEPVALAVGMQKALEIWATEREQRAQRLEELRNRLESRIRSSWPDATAPNNRLLAQPNIVVHSAEAPRLPNTLCVSFPGLNRQSLVIALDLAGVACSTGSACASGSSDPSPTLLAMGCPEHLVECAVRFSLGATTTREEVDRAAERIAQVGRRLAAASPAAVTITA